MAIRNYLVTIYEDGNITVTEYKDGNITVTAYVEPTGYLYSSCNGNCREYKQLDKGDYYNGYEKEHQDRK